MTSNATRPAPSRGHDLTPRCRVAIGMLACAALVACAKGKDASADSAAVAATPTADSVATTPATPAPSTAPADSTTPSPVSTDGAEKQATRATTTPSEAKRLDEATRAVARQGAATRDTARTGAVTPAPAVRKTATTASATSRTAAPTTATTAAPKSTTTAAASKSAPSTAAARDTDPAGAPAAPAAPAAQQTASAQGDNLTASPAAYQGWKTFHVYCYRCHGTDAMGSDLAPNLRHSVGPQGSVNHDVFVTTVKEGRVPKGMPAWNTLLTDEQIENLWAYVRARSTGALAAGRPRQGKSD